MITVIADDLTGAAEIGGIGWRHGLKAKILSRDEPPVDVDLLLYDLDSRLCSATEAARRVTRMLKRVQRMNPAWVFKKVDSVLRGNVLAELEAAMRTLHLNHCLLVPANPRAGRTIRNGRYFIHSAPIDRTDFSNDPHHPRSSPSVMELLGPSGRLPLSVRKPTSRLLPKGVIVGEAASSRDVQCWAGRVDEGTLAAGGGEFFTAMLQRNKSSTSSNPVGFNVRELASPDQPAICSERVRKVVLSPQQGEGSGVMGGLTRDHGSAFHRPKPSGRTLFICGSLAKQAVEFMRAREASGWPVLRMPKELAGSARRVESRETSWRRQIVKALDRNPGVVMTISQPELFSKSAASRLGRIFIEVAARVLVGSRPDWVCVEGGATAAALMQGMKWSRLSVEHEFAPGVTAVRPHGWPDMLLVLKPGSYEWPAALIGQGP